MSELHSSTNPYGSAIETQETTSIPLLTRSSILPIKKVKTGKTRAKPTLKKGLIDHQIQTTRWFRDNMRLKIRKTKSGTYYIPSISTRELNKLAEKPRRRWSLSKDGENLYLEAE